MKILSTEGLTKLIQLIKSNFISINDTVITTTVELADVATSGAIGDLTDVEITNVQNEQVLSYNSTTQKWENAAGGGSGGTVDQTFDATSANAQSGIAISGELDKYQEKLTDGNNIKMRREPIWPYPEQIPNFPNYSTYVCIAYGNNMFVVLNEQGYVSISIDNGYTWTSATQDTNLGNHDWRSLTYGNGKFIALSVSGYISSSTDGTTWTSATQDTNLGSYGWNCLCYGNNKFVAIGFDGNAGYISTSTDGITWSTVVENSNLGKDWRSIVYTAAYFIVIDQDGFTSYSSDGNDWTEPHQDHNIKGYTWESIATVAGGSEPLIIGYSERGTVTSVGDGYGYSWSIPQYQDRLIGGGSHVIANGFRAIICIDTGGDFSIYDEDAEEYIIDTNFGIDQVFNANSTNPQSGKAIANTFVPKDAGNYHIANSTNSITLTYADNDSHPTKQYGLGVSEQMGVMAAAMDMTDQTSPKMLMAGLTSDGIMLQNAVTSTTAILGVSSNNNLTVNGVEITSTSIDNTTVTKNASNELQTVAVIDNNTSNAIKTWTGTKAEYDAIATKDPHTLYNVIGVETDADQIITELANKTNTNFDNVTNEAKVLMSGMGMPSNKYVNLTLGASGTTYTAPANGWFYIHGNSSANTNFHSITIFYNSVNNWNTPVVRVCHNAPSAGTADLVPVKKEQTIRIEFSEMTMQHVVFVYAQGSESEVQ